MARTEKLSGGIAVARTMMKCGADHFFYESGGLISDIVSNELDRLGGHPILCRNEKAATNMADGYSRVTGKPSVCYGQAGAAAMMIASMMYEPMYAHSPVVALTGAHPPSERDRWDYQECYEMKSFESTCKFNVDVTQVGRLAEYMRTAIQVAVSGCPGPTHINMAYDINLLVGEMPELYGDSTFFQVPPFRPRPESARVAAAAELLVKARRPVLMCGTGIHLSGAYDELRKLAELLTIPVVVNPGAKGCFPEDHPLYVGVIGGYGREQANEFVRGADLVFFVATRAGAHTTEDLSAPAPGAAKIIHLDIDPIAIGRNYKADVPLVGDARVALQELLANLRNRMRKAAPKQGRIKDVARSVKAFEAIVKPMMDSNSVPVWPQRIMKEITEFLGPRDILTSDTGQTLCWTCRMIRLKGTGRRYIPVGGTLGSGLAMSMGVAFGAGKGQRVIHYSGDGGMGYNIAELETMVRRNDEHAPWVVVVNNNSSYAMGRYRFEDFTKKKAPYMKTFDTTTVSWAKVAEGLGCYGARVEKPADIQDALRAAFASGKPGLVEVMGDVRQYIPTGVRRKTATEQIRKAYGVPAVY
jgi:acetolactate synthase I/II/III large subunit